MKGKEKRYTKGKVQGTEPGKEDPVICPWTICQIPKGLDKSQLFKGDQSGNSKVIQKKKMKNKREKER